MTVSPDLTAVFPLATMARMTGRPAGRPRVNRVVDGGGANIF